MIEKNMDAKIHSIKLGSIIKGRNLIEIKVNDKDVTREKLVKKIMRNINVRYFDNGWFIRIDKKWADGQRRGKLWFDREIFFPDLLAWRYFETTNYHFTREKREWKIDGRAITRNFNKKKFLTFRCVTPRRGHKLSLLNTFLFSWFNHPRRKVDRF